MKRKISDEHRKFVAKRAGYRCEYCHLPDRDGLVAFHIEHIRSNKHGGNSATENLAYSCPDCNLYKGSDLGTTLNNEETITRFFHPRKDEWSSHFKVKDCIIYPQTNEAEATIKILQMNKPDRVELRVLFAEEGLYP